jgi:hypothetical protein
MTGIAMAEFRENLPPNCPPPNTNNRAMQNVFRFVSAAKPTLHDFLSHGAKGKVRPVVVSECRWMSCSLFPSKKIALKKLPKIREEFKFLAKLDIQKNAGYFNVGGDHIDFWMFKSFDPISSIKSIEPVTNG